MKRVTIYTDGACSKNPGPGGWAALLMYNSYKKELSGYEAETTNNRMELMAAIGGLQALNQACRVELYTDSAYLCNAFKLGWLENWKNNGWRTANKKPVENKDLWLMIAELCDKHSITWHKVKGHADNEYNNRCDALARAEVKKHVVEAKQKAEAKSERTDVEKAQITAVE